MENVSLIDGHIDNEKYTKPIRIDAEIVKSIERNAIRTFAECLKKRIIDKYPLKESDVLHQLIISEISYYSDFFIRDIKHIEMPEDYSFEVGV